MSDASCSESESDRLKSENKKNKRNKVQRASTKKSFDYEDESLADKLNTLLSSSASESSRSEPEDEDEDGEDIIQMDDNGYIRDFHMISDALEYRRVENKTFNELELREIERKNSILMNKILKPSRRPVQFNASTTSMQKVSSSYTNRKKQQQKIDRDNMLLLKKIQNVKPFGLSKPKK